MADPTESSWETATWHDSDTTLLYIAVNLDIAVLVWLLHIKTILYITYILWFELFECLQMMQDSTHCARQKWLNTLGHFARGLWKLHSSFVPGFRDSGAQNRGDPNRLWRLFLRGLFGSLRETLLPHLLCRRDTMVRLCVWVWWVPVIVQIAHHFKGNCSNSGNKWLCFYAWCRFATWPANCSSTGLCSEIWRWERWQRSVVLQRPCDWKHQ